MALLYVLLRNWRPVTVSRVFGKGQLLSAAYMGFSHGSNDAQKTMGIIALALVAGTTAGTFDPLPSFLGFLRIPAPGAAVSASQNLLGVMCRDGLGGVPSSDDRAVGWFQKAAETKNPDAQENLAAMLQAGRGIGRNDDAASALLKSAAETRKGRSPAPFALHAPKMKDAPAEASEAAAWYSQVMAKGRADAADAKVNLGVRLLEGKGTSADPAQALDLFHQAARKHSAEAMANLGILHLEGRGVPKDEAAARHWLQRCVDREGIATWIKVVCALTMAAGTAAGGWRIIKTMGHKMVKLQPVHGFAAETTAATVLFAAAHFGMPVSTTHAISASIMGVGAAKRFSALKWTVVERILWAWFFTLPAAAVIAYGTMWLARLIGLAA
jgi:phosphate/sulfate permease